MPENFLKNLKTGTSTSSSILVEWELTKELPTNFSSFQLSYGQEAWPESYKNVLLPNEQRSHNINKLVSHTEYQICVSALDKGQTLDKLCYKTTTPKWTGHWAIGMSIGTAIAILIVIFCVFLARYMYKQRRRKMRKQCNMRCFVGEMSTETRHEFSSHSIAYSDNIQMQRYLEGNRYERVRAVSETVRDDESGSEDDGPAEGLQLKHSDSCSF